MVDAKVEKTAEKNVAPKDEWTVVSEGTAVAETKMVFESFGDCFVGTYLGMREIPSPEGAYYQARFEADGEKYFTNANYSLRDGLSKVRNGSRVRVTLTDEQDTGMENAMRVYRVEVSRQMSARSPIRPSHNS